MFRRRERPGPAGPPPHTCCPAADALLVAVAQRDVAALGAVYDLTAPMVFRLLCRALDDPAQAERVTERVYLRLWRHAPRVDAAGTCTVALLLTTVHHELGRLCQDQAPTATGGVPASGGPELGR